jgi:SAM-dependent methyltransferase
MTTDTSGGSSMARTVGAAARLAAKLPALPRRLGGGLGTLLGAPRSDVAVGGDADEHLGRTVVAAQNDERVRYHKDVPTLAADHPWHRIHARIAPGAAVLDVGCGSGELGQLVGQTAGSVDGIELNEDRAAEARTHLRTVVAAPGGPAADEALPGPYDVVIFADVLEHIAEPVPTLTWAASKLAADGKILALIPNSANWKVRRKILKGDWSYADTGYFDRDHVRFFDVSTARALGAEAGLRESAIEYVPGALPKPLANWARGAAFAAEHRPNLFAGHVLVEWRAGRAQDSSTP